MIKIWQSLLTNNYKGNEASVLAALVATLFAKDIISREELDRLQEMMDANQKVPDQTDQPYK